MTIKHTKKKARAAMGKMWTSTFSFFLLSVCAMPFGGVSAQQSQYSLIPPTAQPPVPTPPSSVMPDEYRLNLMIRGTIVALNQANVTGNYTVLRELGTPGFQMANNPSRLSEIFAPLRNRKVDLLPTIFFNPKLVSAPVIQDGQVLRLSGFFQTTPEQVNFDLAFQMFGEQWMLAGIGVNTAPPSEAKTASTSSLPSPAQGGESKSTSADGKSIRIDLSEPAPLPPKKPAKKQKAAAQPAAPAADAPPKPSTDNAPDDGGSHTKTAGANGNGWRPE